MPSESWSRKRAGTVSRSLESRECSYWPRNAKAMVRGREVWTGVVRWEEPHHPGPWVNSFGHASPLSPTLQHGLCARLHSLRRTELLTGHRPRPFSAFASALDAVAPDSCQAPARSGNATTLAGRLRRSCLTP